MRVSCIIPAYNEGATIDAVVRAARGCAQVHEVIVVSDGSTDETAMRAADAGADQVIDLPRNQGKGSAVAAAVSQTNGDVLLLLDADLCGLKSAHLTQLLAPVLNGQADMAVALFADDRLHGILRRLSGQRALRRRFLHAPEMLTSTGFGLELALDRLVKQERGRVVLVKLTGLKHRRKREKHGMVKGLRLEIKNTKDLLRQVLKAVARKERQRRPKSKRPPGGLGGHVF